MKARIGIGWVLVAVALGIQAYGWKGAFWVLIGGFVYIYTVFPIVATIVKRGLK